MADRPSALQRIAGAVLRRMDGPIVPPPVPQPAAPARRSIRQRLDSAVRNTFLGIGEDKVQQGRPDLYRYPLVYQELTTLWRFSGHARRYVEIVPNDATRQGWKVLAGEDVLDEMDEEHKRLNVFAKVCEADTWGRLYGGCWLLLVTTDDRTGTNWAEETSQARAAWLAEPLDIERVVSLDNLVVLDWSEVTPSAFDPDIRSPTFRQPLKYRLHLNAGGMARHDIGAGTEVHTTRLLYFPGQLLPPQERYQNNGCDDSILQSVWDQIRNTATLDHSLAVLAAEMRISVLKMRDLADVSISDEAAYFDYRMRELVRHKSVANTILLGDGEEYDHKAGTVAGMSELVNTTRQALQAVTGMPEQLWIGSAPGGLSTDGDSHRNLWANVISSYQWNKYEPMLVKLYSVIFAARLGPWAGVAPDDWGIDFNPLDELTQKGKADLRKVTADMDIAYIQAGVLDPKVVADARFGAKGWQDEIPPVVDVAPEVGGLNVAAIESELGAPPPAVDPVTGQPIVTDEEEPEPSAAERLAAQLTEHQVARCEHGSINRCRMCGIERSRSLKLAPDGTPARDAEGNAVWALEWVPIKTDGRDPADAEDGSNGIHP